MAGALRFPFDPLPQYNLQGPPEVKQEPIDDYVYPPFTSEYDNFDLDAALFDADAGWDAGLDACFFDGPIPTDGAVPTLDALSDGGGGIPTSASCSSLDSACSSESAEDLLGGKVPTGARSRRGGGGGAAHSGGAARLLPPSAGAGEARSAPLVPAAKPWTPPTVLPPLSMTRQERVQRYREKRKRRTFEKTIRYEARRAYAEVRPRIKGRFATKDEAAAMKAAKLAGVPYEC